MEIEKLSDQQIRKVTLKNIGVFKEFSVLAQDVNEISGLNEAGKTTFMGSIFKAIDGRKSGKDCILSNGEKYGSATIETEDLIIEIEASRNDDGVVNEMITAKIKGVGKCTRKDISSLFKGKTIDPLEFYKMSSLDRSKNISEMLGEEFKNEMNSLKYEKESLYDNRRDLKRDLSKLSTVKIPEKVEKISIKESVNELNKAVKHNSQCRELKNDYSIITSKYKSKEVEIKSQEEQIDLAKKKLELLKEDLSEIVKNGKELKKTLSYIEEIDLDPIQKKIDESGDVNSKYDEYISAIDRNLKYEDAEKEYGISKKKYSDHCGKVEKFIHSAKLPVDGLIMKEEGLYYKDVLFSDLNTAKQIELSLKLAVSNNNKFKILMISDGNSLDQKAFKMVCSFAKEHGYQIWMESVIPHSEDALYIESGNLKEMPDLFKKMLKG